MSSRRPGLLSNAPPSAQRPRNSAPPNTSSNRTAQTQLPPYEPPICALDLTARRALNELSNNATDTRKYTAELATSIKLLGEGISEVNDRYTDRKARLRGRLERRRADGEEVDDDTRALQEAVRSLGQEVPEITAACDEGVREVIDWGVELEDARTAMNAAVREVENESREAEMRETAAKERRERLREAREQRMEHGLDDEDDNDDAEKDEEEEDEPVSIAGPLRRLRDNKRKLQADYEDKSLHQRYGLNNDYINFKRLWHDAVHSVDKKPLPDASRWFNDNGGEEAEEEDDEDLIVAGEKKDLRCPLSMVMMTEPFTSAKCNHTFEKAAIVEFLRGKPGRTARCPLTGCDKVGAALLFFSFRICTVLELLAADCPLQQVSLDDFSLDQYMLRQIKRSQRQDEEDDDENMEEEEEDADPDESMRVTSQRQIKRERRPRDVIEDDENQYIDEA